MLFRSRVAIHAREAFIEKYAPKSYVLSELHNVELDGVDTRDYPDFANAFLQDAMYEGRWLSEYQINEINDKDSDWVHAKVHNNLDTYFYSDEDN